MFDTLSICEFLAKMWTSYLCVTKECITRLLPFSNTYLYESRFFTLMQIKSKTLNQLNVKNCLRSALSAMHPRIEKLFHCVHQQFFY